MVKWTQQPGNGTVMICMDVQGAEIELLTGGCADVTEEVKNDLIESLKKDGFDDVEHFDWMDWKGKTYWHIIEPNVIDGDEK